MQYVSCEVRTEHLNVVLKKVLLNEQIRSRTFRLTSIAEVLHNFYYRTSRTRPFASYPPLPPPQFVSLLAGTRNLSNKSDGYSGGDSVNNSNNNSVALVREGTIPTEPPPLVGKVSTNFCRWRVLRGQRDVSLRPYSRVSRPEPQLFLPSSSSFVLTRLSGHRSRATTSKKIR
jgi:hypothetical protein